jgi:hypothetical protein
MIMLAGLLGVLAHHHESETECDACSYCHASVQVAVADLVMVLVSPSFAFVGGVDRTRPCCLARTAQFSALVSRAPPNHDPSRRTLGEWCWPRVSCAIPSLLRLPAGK